MNKGNRIPSKLLIKLGRNIREVREDKNKTQEEIEKSLAGEFSKLKINNPKIVEWVRKALKEGHKDKIQYHSSSLNELNNRQGQLNKRLEKMYEDKLDEKISESFLQSAIQKIS